MAKRKRSRRSRHGRKRRRISKRSYRRSRKSFKRGRNPSIPHAFINKGIINRIPSRKNFTAVYKDVTNWYLNLSTTGNGVAGVTYQCNSAYDLLASLSTSIPGYSLMSAYYNYYRVHGCKITCQFANDSTDAMYAGIIFPRQPGSALNFASTASQWREFLTNNYSKVCLLNSVNASNCMRKLSLRVNFSKLYGDAQFWTTKDFAAAVTTNPTTIFYGQIVIFDASGGAPSASRTCFVNTTVTLYGQFYEPIVLQS